jgi:hypothetical protein
MPLQDMFISARIVKAIFLIYFLNKTYKIEKNTKKIILMGSKQTPCVKVKILTYQTETFTERFQKKFFGKIFYFPVSEIREKKDISEVRNIFLF